MDRQTELPWHIRAIAYMLSRVKNEKLFVDSNSNTPTGVKVKSLEHKTTCMYWMNAMLTLMTVFCTEVNEWERSM